MAKKKIITDIVQSVIPRRSPLSVENVRKLVEREASLPTHEMAYRDIEKALKRARIPHDVKWKYGRSKLPPASEQIFDFQTLGDFPHGYLEPFDQPITSTGVTGAVRPAIHPQMLRDLLKEAREGAMRGKQEWYDLSPLGRFALDEVGPEAIPSVQRFIKLGTPLSQRTRVPDEIIAATRLNRLMQEMGESGLDTQAASDIVQQFTQGAGTSAKLDNIRRTMGGLPTPRTQVKLGAYEQARAGNLYPPAIDSKVLRLMGLKENIGPDQKGAASAVIKALAARTGVEPAKLQAMLWKEGISNRYSGGADEAYATVVNNMLYRASQKLGEDPKRYAIDVLSGKADIPFSSLDLGYKRGGPVKLAVGGALTRYVKSLLPKEMRDLPLRPIRGGTGRQAFWLGDDRVAKIARLPEAPTKGETYRGLYENTLIDDPILQRKGLLPRLDYMDPLGEMYVAEALKKPMPRAWLKGMDDIWSANWGGNVMNEAIEFDPRLEPFSDYSVLMGDFMAPRHWKARMSKVGKPSPVLIDEGSLSDRIWNYEHSREQASRHGLYTDLWDISDIQDRRADFLNELKRENRQRLLDGIKQRALGKNQMNLDFDFRRGGPVRFSGGGLAKVLRDLKRVSGGDYSKQARQRAMQRLERLREEVPASDTLYSPRALHDALMSPKSRLASMRPEEYERAAAPLSYTKSEEVGRPLWHAELPQYEQEHVQALLRLIEEGEPFHDIPELYLGARLLSPGLKPSVRGHEGRHRSRAIKLAGHDKALVNLHGFPSVIANPNDVSGGDMERALKSGLDVVEKGMRPGGEFEPQLHNIFSRGRELIPYNDVFLSEPWKRGGSVKLNPDTGHALKQARKLMAAGGPAKAIRNFLRGVKGSHFDDAISRLKQRVRVPDEALRGEQLDDAYAREKAMEQWIDKNLSNYLVRQHGTPEDPLADVWRERAHGQLLGYPGQNISALTKRPAAEWWDKLAGITEGANPRASITKYRIAADPHGMMDKPVDPPEWFMNLVEKDWPRHWSQTQYNKASQDIDALTRVYKDSPGAVEDMKSSMGKYLRKDTPPIDLYDLDPTQYGRVVEPEFSDALDYLRHRMTPRQTPTGPITDLQPEALARMGVPDAIKGSREWHAQMAKQAEKAGKASLEAVPTYKEYPGGWRWVELKASDPGDEFGVDKLKGFRERDDEVVEAARGIGRQLGHCYQDPETCEDYLSHSTLYSLIDPHGKARATVEASMPKGARGDILSQKYPDVYEEYLKGQPGLMKFLREKHPKIADELGLDKMSINQIRGPQFPPYNAKVAEDARPYVADLLNSSEWNNVREAEEHAGVKRIFTEGKSGKQRALWLTDEQAKPFERYKWYATKKDEADPRQWWANKEGEPTLLTKDEWIARHIEHTGDKVPWSPQQSLRTYVIPDDWTPQFAEGGAVSLDDIDDEAAGIEYLLGSPNH